MSRPILILTLYLVGCGITRGEPPPEGPSPLDAAAFEAHVWPLFEAQCAQPSCHGSAERSFTLYGPRALRLGGLGPLAPISAEELSADHQAAYRLLEGLDDPLRSILLLKPLRPEAGGLVHEGGSQFYDRSDPGFLTLACWISGSGDCWP